MPKVHLDQAIRLIQQAEVVAIPTETVYGLAGAAVKKKALKKIFQIKNRPSFNPLIVHCFSSSQMQEFHTVRHLLLDKMIEAFCPGPLTFVLDKSYLVQTLVTAGREKVGLRIPNHPLTLKLIQSSGFALCAPSANKYGELSPTRVEHVMQSFNIPVLDGGTCEGGIESTVIEIVFNLNQINILRPGLISKEQLQNFLSTNGFSSWKVCVQEFSSLSPGQAKKHYAPNVPLVIVHTSNKLAWTKKEIKNLMQKKYSQTDRDDFSFKELQLKDSPELSARFLYNELHKLSSNSQCMIYVYHTPLNSSGKWEAIWDRLTRAATYHLP